MGFGVGVGVAVGTGVAELFDDPFEDEESIVQLAEPSGLLPEVALPLGAAVPDDP